MMKSAFVALAVALAAAPAIAEETAPAAAEAASETVVAKVNGMVCDFCAQAVTKVFKREDAVESVNVDLDNGAITIAMKPGQSLDDARVAELVKKSGYALVAIERG